LCAAHARLIDRDAGTYTIERLQQAKRDHEARCASELLEPSVNDDRALDERRGDLFGVGPDIVCLGQITNVDEAEWGFRIEHFVVGDLNDVVAFINGYEQRSAYDRHVLDNKLGDGRVLGGAPSLATSNNRYVLRCPVQPKFPRTSAADFPQDLALFSNGNDSGLVSGLAAFSQHVFVSLGTQKGSWLFHRDFGTRLSEYHALYRGSPWLAQLLKLEVIRQSAIPLTDDLLGQQYTPLHCVERVWSVEVIGEAPESHSLTIRLDLEVNGIGRWQHEIFVLPPAK